MSQTASVTTENTNVRANQVKSKKVLVISHTPTTDLSAKVKWRGYAGGVINTLTADSGGATPFSGDVLLVIIQKSSQGLVLPFFGLSIVQQFVVKMKSEQKRIKVKGKLLTVNVFSKITNPDR